jgi:hypothetical protein
MKANIAIDADLETIAKKMLDGGDSDTIIEFLNITAAHISATHAKSLGPRGRFMAFASRAHRKLDGNAIMLLETLVRY